MSAWLEGGFVHPDPLVEIQDREADRELRGGTTGGDTSAEVPVVQLQDDVETRISEAELEQLGQVAFPFCYIEAA